MYKRFGTFRSTCDIYKAIFLKGNTMKNEQKQNKYKLNNKRYLDKAIEGQEPEYEEEIELYKTYGGD